MIEARHNDDGTLDEVVASGVDFHLEQLSDGVWWIGLELPDGKRSTVVLSTARGAKVSGRYEVET